MNIKLCYITLGRRIFGGSSKHAQKRTCTSPAHPHPPPPPSPGAGNTGDHRVHRDDLLQSAAEIGALGLPVYISLWVAVLCNTARCLTRLTLLLPTGLKYPLATRNFDPFFIGGITVWSGGDFKGRFNLIEDLCRRHSNLPFPTCSASQTPESV